MEENNFTIASVLYTMTGAVPIIEFASEEYRKQAAYEIKNDLVYSFVLSDIPEEDRFYDEHFPDYDPIVNHYICSKYPEIKELRNRYKEEQFNPNVIINYNYVSLEKINKDDYYAFAKMFKNKVKRMDSRANNRLIKNKILHIERKIFRKEENTNY